MNKEVLKVQLKELKDSLINRTFDKDETLASAVERLQHGLTDKMWSETNEGCYVELCERLVFLLEAATTLIEAENHQELNTYFEEHLSISLLKFREFSGGRGHRIQVFEQTEAPIYIVGDLHGDVTSLKTILEKTGFYESQLTLGHQTKWVFLGDYLDRGKRQIELLERLLILKCLFPQSIYLFRGNHELGTLEAGRIKLGIRKPEADPDSDYLLLLLESYGYKAPELTLELLQALITFFHRLSVCGFVKQGDKVYMLNHGGIIRPKHEDVDQTEDDFFMHFNRLSELTNGDVRDDLGNTLEHNLLWSDPSDEWILISEETRRFRFHLDHFSVYRKALGFDVLVRGHEAFPEGIKTFFENRIISVFSSGSKDNEDTAYPEVTPQILVIEQGTLSEINLQKVQVS